MPRLYTLALEQPVVHVIEHGSFVGTAVLLWWRILVPRGDRRAARGLGVLLLLATVMQSGALGAMLALGRAPWFSAHAAGARLWGLTPLEDQQLAGLIMWVPGGLLYIAAAAALFAAWIGGLDATRPRRVVRQVVA
jgi:cytochrome c oxidase assembly factor CtaG